MRRQRHGQARRQQAVTLTGAAARAATVEPEIQLFQGGGFTFTQLTLSITLLRGFQYPIQPKNVPLHGGFEASEGGDLWFGGSFGSFGNFGGFDHF